MSKPKEMAMSEDQIEPRGRILGWKLATHYGPEELESYGQARGITWTRPGGSIDGYDDRED